MAEFHSEHRTVEVPVRKEQVVIERRPARGQEPSGAAGDSRREEIRGEKPGRPEASTENRR